MRCLSAILPLILILLFFSSGCSEKEKPAAKEKPGKNPASKSFERGPLKVNISFTPEKPTFLDQVKLSIKAEIQNDYKLTMPSFAEGLSEFNVRDFSEESPTKTKDKTSYISNYILDIYVSGDYTIHPMTFSFTKKDGNLKDKKKAAEEKKEASQKEKETPGEYKLKTKEIKITVNPLKDAKILKKEKVIPPYPPEELPTPPEYILWYILGASVIAILLAVIIFKYLRKRINKVFMPPPLSAHESAFRELRDLIEANLPGKGRIKEFYFRLTFIVRNYIEKRFNLRAPELTTEEFLPIAASSGVLEERHQSLLKDFLSFSDLIKYAKHEAGADDIENNFNAARRFINETKQDSNQNGGTSATS